MPYSEKLDDVMALFTGLSPLLSSVHQLIWDLDSTAKTWLPMCTNRQKR